jgi:hypothetical protein
MRHPYKIFIAESSTVVQKISPLSGQIAIWATPFGKAMSFALWKKKVGLPESQRCGGGRSLPLGSKHGNMAMDNP